MDSKLILIFLAIVTLCTVVIAYDTAKCDAPPSEEGVCRAYIPSWVYKEKKCQQIIYGGCDATANIFSTIEACKTACQN